MATTQISQREQEILDATLALVAEQGLLNTSISKISKQAEASPGIVYHYFESKDAIMHALFERIIKEMMNIIMQGLQKDAPALERYKHVWLNKYHYHINHPAKTIFVEQYKNSSYYSAEQAKFMEECMADLVNMGEQDIAQGWVLDLPRGVMYTMTFTVALELAKSHMQSDVRPEQAMLEMIAERVCRSVIV
jgi:AcrR family transcriptional regulator